MGRPANPGRSAARVGGNGAILAALTRLVARVRPAALVRLAAFAGLVALELVAGCAGLPEAPAGRVFTAPAPSEAERYCAWFGDERDGVLYFGEAPFWSGLRDSGGDPTADLRRPGPQPIGRFDLRRDLMLPALEVGAAGSRSGVWDVLAHPNGRIYFTNYFEAAGFVDPASGAVRHLPELGLGLNEIAAGPGHTLLVTRYGQPNHAREREASGSVVVIDAEGALLAEHPLAAGDGLRLAPKSVAWDPARREIWLTTDLLDREDRTVGHPTVVLDEHGTEVLRRERPELQFIVFGSDGTGYRAEALGRTLWLATAPPGGPLQRAILDEAFPADLDFVQDVRLAPGGAAVVTRWSGAVHVVESDGLVRTVQLPSLEPGGLYYTAVRDGDRICATYCGGVTVVCESLPDPRRP